MSLVRGQAVDVSNAANAACGSLRSTDARHDVQSISSSSVQGHHVNLYYLEPTTTTCSSVMTTTP